MKDYTSIINDLYNHIDDYDFEYASYDEIMDCDIEKNCKELLLLLKSNQNIPFKIQLHWNESDGFYYIVEYYEDKIHHHIEIYDSDFEMECMFYSKDDIIKVIEKLYQRYFDTKKFFTL